MHAQVGGVCESQAKASILWASSLRVFSVMHVFPFAWVSYACLHIKHLCLLLAGGNLFNT